MQSQFKALTTFKVQSQDFDNFQVKYEMLASPAFIDFRKVHIKQKISEIDTLSSELQIKIDVSNKEVEQLTNNADSFDYSVAVGCGVFCGLIDSFVIGDFDFKKAKDKSNEQVNNFIMKFAKLNGFDGERLDKAIEFLEKKFPVAQDNIWKTAGISVGTKNHHLADFAHHPTLLGLVAAILVQFFRMGIFVNRKGEWHFEGISTKPEDVIKIWLPVVISGLLLWLCNIAESKFSDKIDEKIPKPIQEIIKALAAAPALIPILKVSANWAGHLVSDMGGSKNTAGGGMGIAGLFLSLLHEISSLPILNKTPLPQIVNDLYTKEKFDMRAELAVLNELGRQAVPVLIGEILVRGFFFVRRLVNEYNEHGNFESINWNSVIPLKNKTIARMMTIESGTFTAIDLADATIRSTMKNGFPNNPLFWKDFVLRVNYVGIGRFSVAVATDIGMGIKRQKKIDERLKLKSECLMLQNAKIFYLQEDMWIEAESTEQAMKDLFETVEKSETYFIESAKDIFESLKRIDIKKAKNKNPDLIAEMKDILEWG